MPVYAKAPVIYPSVAESAEAQIPQHMNDSAMAFAFIHG
jgi:hypothetical protein